MSSIVNDKRAEATLEAAAKQIQKNWKPIPKRKQPVKDSLRLEAKFYAALVKQCSEPHAVYSVLQISKLVVILSKGTLFTKVPLLHVKPQPFQCTPQ